MCLERELVSITSSAAGSSRVWPNPTPVLCCSSWLVGHAADLASARFAVSVLCGRATAVTHFLHVCRSGAVVLEAGERVGVAEVGILATVGAVSLPVHRRPKVAVLSTGELSQLSLLLLLGPHAVTTPVHNTGQIRDCNTPTLCVRCALHIVRTHVHDTQTQT